MKKYLSYLLVIGLLGACSSPKYTYYFDHYDYNAGKKKTNVNKVLNVERQSEQMLAIGEAPLSIDKESVTACAEEKGVVVPETAKNISSAPGKKYKDMTKTERKEFRKEARQLIKSYVKVKKEGNDSKAGKSTNGMDHDLKLAAIFGAIGIVLLLIGGDVIWALGAISLIIGVVFLVLWMSRQ